MSFEEFNGRVKQSDIDTKNVKKIFVEKDILSPLYSKKIVKFKLEQDKSILIHSSKSSQFLIQGIDEHKEKEKEEKSREYNEYIESIENNNNNINNINNISNSSIDISFDDNNYMEINLNLEKDLIFLFNIEKNIIKKNSNNSNYYYLKLHSIIKYYQLDLKKVSSEIEEFKGYTSLKKYLKKKYFEDENMSSNIDRIIYFNQSENNRDNNIQKNNHINNRNETKYGLNKNLSNNSNNKKKIANNKIITQEIEEDSDNNDIITNDDKENNNHRNTNERRNEVDFQKETTFGSDSLKSETINYNNNRIRNKEKENLLKFKAAFEVGDNLNKFKSNNNGQFEKKKFWNILGFILFFIVAYYFPSFVKEYSEMYRSITNNGNK